MLCSIKIGLMEKHYHQPQTDVKINILYVNLFHDKDK